MIFNNCNTIYK